MRKLPALIALGVCLGGLAGCGSTSNATDDPEVEPEAAALTSPAADPNDDFQPLRVNMVAQAGTYFPDGVKGVVFGCSDTLVSVTTVPIQTQDTEEHVASAIQFLLDDSQYYHGDPAVTNSLTLSETLELQDVEVGRDDVDIALSGDLVVQGECEAYRIQAQLYGTAALTAETDEVSITINDQDLNDLLGLEPFDTTQIKEEHAQ